MEANCDVGFSYNYIRTHCTEGEYLYYIAYYTTFGGSQPSVNILRGVCKVCMYIIYMKTMGSLVSHEYHYRGHEPPQLSITL